MTRLAILLLLSGCATSTYVNDAALADATSTVPLDEACTVAADAYTAADARLACHQSATCCNIPNICTDAPVPRLDVDACAAARMSAATCDDLTPPSCWFSLVLPER